MRCSRRHFVRLSATAAVGLALPWKMGPFGPRPVLARLGGGSLDPSLVPKYVSPLVKPPAMPSSGGGGQYYEIAMRQFQQQILPPSLPKTTVWGYGAVEQAGTVAEGGSFYSPAFTVEAIQGQPVTVKWVNDLVDADGNYLPHLLPVDQTIHWANPGGGLEGRDGHHSASHVFDQSPYRGPVPIVSHLHGAHSTEESDGYPEAWYLPVAKNIPDGYATTGTYYDRFVTRYGLSWEPGSATYRYPNDKRAFTSWYHDHALGLTRLNVYAGPAGFYLVRGGTSDLQPGTLPGPAPAVGDDPFGTYYEIPIAIQDRSFNDDGSLFYPDNRAFFEDLQPDQLQIPFKPDEACNGQASDIAPIWVPEFFGDSMMVNGVTWPYLEVEQRRYRLRLLNGCGSRFLILKMSNGQKFHVMGSDGGFLPKVIELDQLLLGPAERYDVIVDFTNVPVGTEVILQNLAPDEPYGGGVPGVDFDPADPNTTGQVMQFRVVAATSADPSTPPMDLKLPAYTALGVAENTRLLSLNEEESQTVLVSEEDGNIELDCEDGEPFGPKEALLGVLAPDGKPVSLGWDDPVSETPLEGTTEMWEIHNNTADAHPIHVHLVMFEVMQREDVDGNVRARESWESGYKDTVIAYPGEITRIKAKFDIAGLYVWHCHILEHEDNEMMRPYQVIPRTDDHMIPAREDVDYVVEPGDTLAVLALRFLGDSGRFDLIVTATNEKHGEDASYAQIDDPGALEVGWKLLIPAVGG